MATGRITKRSVDALEPGDRDKLLWDTDTPGFGLKVTTAGTRHAETAQSGPQGGGNTAREPRERLA